MKVAILGKINKSDPTWNFENDGGLTMVGIEYKACFISKI